MREQAATYNALDEMSDARVEVTLLEEESEDGVRRCDCWCDLVPCVVGRVAKHLGHLEEERRLR